MFACLDEYFSFEQFVRILSLAEDSDQTSEELKKTFRVRNHELPKKKN